jgi:hypothetical protein
VKGIQCSLFQGIIPGFDWRDRIKPQNSHSEEMSPGQHPNLGYQSRNNDHYYMMEFGDNMRVDTVYSLDI